MTPTPKPTPTVCPTCQFEGGEHQRDCEKNVEPWEKKFDQKFWYLENDNLHKPHGDGCQCRATLSIDIKSFICSLRSDDEKKLTEKIEKVTFTSMDDYYAVLDIIKSYYKK